MPINIFAALKGKAIREAAWKDPAHPANWQEDLVLDNGDYLNQCRGPCKGTMFRGHKRRILCKVCAQQPA